MLGYRQSSSCAINFDRVLAPSFSALRCSPKNENDGKQERRKKHSADGIATLVAIIQKQTVLFHAEAMIDDQCSKYKMKNNSVCIPDVLFTTKQVDHFFQIQ